MLALSIVSLSLLALLSPLAFRLAGRRTVPLGIICGGVSLGWAAYFATQLWSLAGGGAPKRAVYPWSPELGLDLTFHADGLSLLFAVLICGIGGLVLLYAGRYMRGNDLSGRFFAYLVGFLVSMLGLVLADNILLVFAFWELTSITSFLLIGFDHHRRAARDAARQALVTTGLGGLLMLAGLVLIGQMAGSFELSEIVQVPLDPSLPGYTAALVLLLAGCFTKSAQFPFHYWLPNAMEGPSPVSALLHSSTMVKAGVYLLARLNPAMGHDAVWVWVLVGFGAWTSVFAAWMAFRKTKLKAVLAYSTVSSLGLMVAMIGLAAPAAGDLDLRAYAGAALASYLIAHALFKACLFMAAGAITKVTGEKDTEKLRGLLRAMPVTSVAVLIGAASMAGLPLPLMGFVGKETVLKASLKWHATDWSHLALVAMVGVGAVAMTAAAARLVWTPLRGGAPQPASGDGNASPHREPPVLLWIGPALLAVLTVLVTLVPMVVKPAVTAAAEAVSGVKPHPKLGYFTLLTPSEPALWISVGAVVLGIGLFALRRVWAAGLEPIAARLDSAGPEQWYESGMAGLLKGADKLTRALQNGLLSFYVRVTVTSVAVLSGLALVRALVDNNPQPEWSFAEADVLEVLLAASILAAVTALAATRARLGAIAMLGVVGFAIAVLFVVFGAPDVAATQFAAETLTVIIFVLTIYHLPRTRLLSRPITRVTDGVIAAVFGGVLGFLSLAAGWVEPMSRVSEFHKENAVTLANGRNVVNVILVDFRALDTLGEIVVLGVAAVGVYTLLRVRSSSRGVETRTDTGRAGADRRTGREGDAA